MSLYTTERVPFPPYVENELRPEFLGFGALNPFAGNNSSPRASMFNKHMGQTMVIAKPETRFIQTGVEREIAKYTFNIGFENNSYIIDVIPKYRQTEGIHYIKHSPMTAVIFENADHPDRELDVLYINDHFNIHHYAGFQYKHDTDVLSKIRAGARIKAGTIVSDSPSVTRDGDYQYGVNANILLSSHPGGTEDGVIISESFAKKVATRIYETREFSFGNGVIPLNVYGDENVYKIFPDIGDVVRDDGVLCSLRDYQPELAPCDVSGEMLRNVTTFDKTQYAKPGSIVVDVTVTKGSTQAVDLFSGMDDQVTKYHERHMAFYKRIIDVCNKYKKDRRGQLHLSRELHRLMVEGLALLDNRVILSKKRKKLPPWTVTVTTMYQSSAENGFKITDSHGGKSVTVNVKPDKDMPVDEMGNRADLIVDDKSTIKRLIKGKLHEHYIGACRRDLTTRLRRQAAPYKGRIPDDVYMDIWEQLLGFYKIVSPPFYTMIGEIKPDIYEHVDTVLDKGIYLYIPTDNPVSYMDVAALLRKYYPACHGRLKMANHKGEIIETHSKAIIGQVYYILLDKIANDYSSVASAKLQHFGLPSKPSKDKKYAEPITTNPVRFGESEYRLFVATAGGQAIADLADRSLNPETHEEVLYNLLTAPQPTNVHSLVDRSRFPTGSGYIHRVLKHEFEALGIEVKPSLIKEQNDG